MTNKTFTLTISLNTVLKMIAITTLCVIVYTSVNAYISDLKRSLNDKQSKIEQLEKQIQSHECKSSKTQSLNLTETVIRR